ncbi:MAG: hypothetical protein L3K26_00475 [Candidatus Hydrogenedentes bacterium]|nr:hypothetical protein [Candidatus Hydrogenedentota bacterium]
MLCRRIHLFRSKSLLQRGAVALTAAALVVSGLLSAASAVADVEGVAAPGDPLVVALLAARETAEGQIAQGELVAAGVTIAESLRALPPERVDLSDTAYGNVLLAQFLMVYLMPDPVFFEYINQRLDMETYPTDKLLASVYDIFLGQMDTKGKTDATREIGYLTGSEHRIVRIIALFNASDPYFHRDARFTSQHVETLVREYPELGLTQVAQTLPFYQDQKNVGLAAFEAEAAQKSVQRAQAPLPQWANSLRDRARRGSEALRESDGDPGAITALLEGAKDASDWKERHFCFLMVKSRHGGAQRGALLATAREISQRGGNTPDVMQARILMAKVSSEAAKERPDDPEALIPRDRLRKGLSKPLVWCTMES